MTNSPAEPPRRRDWHDMHLSVHWSRLAPSPEGAPNPSFADTPFDLSVAGSVPDGQYPVANGAALTATGSLPIVERSSRDAWWGAMPSQDNTLTGRNVLGQLLTQLRDLLDRYRDPLTAADALLSLADTSQLTIGGKPAVAPRTAA